MEIQNVIKKNEYNFLRNNKLLNNICLLTVGGSYAYGTHIEGISDYDIRGIATNNIDEILGIKQDWETYVDINTDTTIYSLKKIIKLLMSCNPNTIEILGCRPEDYACVSDIGQMLLNNKNIFLSKKVISSFRGYANQQFNRMFNFYAKTSQTSDILEESMLRSCENKILHFNGTYDNYYDGFLNLRLEDCNKEKLDKELVIDINNITGIPLRELKGILNELNNVLQDYTKYTINHRNKKSTHDKLAKHQMHLFRLYFMLLDILEKQEIITYREKEHDFLMDVRNGLFIKDDNTISKDLIDVKQDLEKKVSYAINNTSLPDKVNEDFINDFVISINKKILIQYY